MTRRDEFDAALRTDFFAFCEKVFASLNPGTLFVDNWHLHTIAYYLWLVQQGDVKRLIINVPPRSLKSMMGSVALPAFIHGHDPTKRIIAVSYSSSLAHELSNQYRSVVQSAWYRRAFAKMIVSTRKNTEGQVFTTEHGFRLATSTEGTLTGRGGDIIIIDDPLKADDALSESKRTAANNWFTNTLLSRLDNKQEGAIIIIMQRLHVDDLTGFVLDRSKEDWKVLSLPAIADESRYFSTGDKQSHFRKIGDVLNAGLEPLQVLNRLKRELGSATFEAQYQQNPVPPGGAMFKRDWIQWYDEPPKKSLIVQSWDTANKDGDQNDWSVCTTWAIANGNFYLLEVDRKRLSYPDLKRRAEENWLRWGMPYKVLVEDSGVGTALIKELKRSGIPTIGILPKEHKEVRASVASATFEAGLVHFPRNARWLDELMKELLAFPRGRHDDQVDSITQAIANIRVPRDVGTIADFTVGLAGAYRRHFQ